MAEEVTVKINGLMKLVLLLVAVACTVCSIFVLYAAANMDERLDCYDRRSRAAMMLVHSGKWEPKEMLNLMDMCSDPVQ